MRWKEGMGILGRRGDCLKMTEEKKMFSYCVGILYFDDLKVGISLHTNQYNHGIGVGGRKKGG